MKILDSKYSRYILFLLFIFTLIWSVLIMPLALRKVAHATGSSTMLDTQPTSEPTGTYQYLERVGEEGRQVLLSIYQFEDFVFPIAYGSFFFFAIAYWLRKSFPDKRFLLLLSCIPLLMVYFDFAENFTIVRLINHYPNQLTSTAKTLGTYTLVKWILGLISGGIFIGSFLIFVVKKIQPSKK